VSTNDYRQLIRDHFAAKERLDAVALHGQLTDGARYWIPRAGAQRGLAERPLVGREKLVEVFTKAGNALYSSKRDWEIEHVLVDGDVGAAQLTLRTTFAVNGMPYENSYAFVFRFEDGKIAEIWEHVDTAFVFDQIDAATAQS
jgi:ketosteroid isomerase-like protein